MTAVGGVGLPGPTGAIDSAGDSGTKREDPGRPAFRLIGGARVSYGSFQSWLAAPVQR